MSLIKRCPFFLHCFCLTLRLSSQSFPHLPIVHHAKVTTRLPPSINMKSTLTTLPLLLLASTTTLANPVAIPVANPVAEPRPESSYNPKANPGNFVCTANGPGIHILKQSDCINFLRNLPITQGMGQVKFNDELTWDPTAPWVVPQPDKHCKVRV